MGGGFVWPVHPYKLLVVSLVGGVGVVSDRRGSLVGGGLGGRWSLVGGGL